MSDDAVPGASERRDVSTRNWNVTQGDAGQSWLTDVDAATAVKSATLISVVLLALGGNGLVVAAVVSYRRLRSVTNHFVVSLAVVVDPCRYLGRLGLCLEATERGPGPVLTTAWAPTDQTSVKFGGGGRRSTTVGSASVWLVDR